MRKLAVVLAALALGACANQRFDLRTSNAAPSLQADQSFFVGGIGQTQTQDAASVCGGSDKVARIEMQDTGMNVLFRALTLGIYTPREMRITCVR